MTYRLGIDIGTCYLTAAAAEPGGTPSLVDLGRRTTRLPAQAFLPEAGDLVVGPAAAERGAAEPHRLLTEAYRALGGTITVFGRTVDPVEVLARQLRFVVDAAAHQRRSLPEQVVVSYPTAWEPDALPHLTRALQEAGLPGAELCPAPVAAAMQYIATHQVQQDERFVICDFGGGYLDVAVLQRTAGGVSLLGSAVGVQPFGGNDVDEVLLAHVHSRLGVAPPTDPASAPLLAALRRNCTEAKEALSSQSDVSIQPPQPGLFPPVTVSRAELEEVLWPPLSQALGAGWSSLQGQGIELTGLTQLVLLGQSAAIPLFRREMERGFGLSAATDVQPKDDVALGAARYAALLPPAAPGGILPAAGGAHAPTTVIPTVPGGGSGSKTGATGIASWFRGRRPLVIGLVAGAILLVLALIAGAVVVIPRLLDDDPPPATPSPTTSTRSPTSSPSPSPSPSPTPQLNLPVSAPLSEDEIVVPRQTRDERALFVLNVNGGQPRRLPAPSGGNYSGASVSPDRRTLIYIETSGGLRTMAADGSGDRELLDPPEGCGRIRHLSWSPTDLNLMVVECQPESGPDQLLVINLEGEILHELRTRRERIDDPTISPDGTRVTYWASDEPDGPNGGSIYTLRVDGAGRPDQLTDVAVGSDADPAYSPDGEEIAFRRRVPGDGYDLWVMRADGSRARELVSGPSRDEKPAYSPDGTRMVFISNRTGSGRPSDTVDLFIMDADGDNIEALGIRSSAILTPTWSHR